MTSETSELTHKALLKVRQKLLDLSKRNRLLNFKETARSIRIVDALPEQVFKTLVTDSKSMSLLYDESEETEKSGKLAQEDFVIKAVEELTSQDEKEKADRTHHHDLNLQTPYTATILERRCSRLLRDSKTAIEETGSNFLFLNIGVLEWYDDEESDICYRAPLILIPVQLERGKVDKENNCYTYKLSYTEEDIETNLSLALKLDNDGIILPELDEHVEPQKYLEEVSQLINHKKRWRVVPDMVIGMFSFAKILMYKDLDSQKWPSGFSNIIENKKIREVLRVKETFTDTDSVIYDDEYEIDGNQDAEKIPLILDADSSQHSVIVDALSARDLVVEGPPGTGKSQTIANLIASALYEGKSVLFIAEKKAALEVVRRRLDLSGLGDFCLELHSTKTQKGKLREDIKKRIKRHFKRPEDLKYLSEDLARERDKLREYINLMNKVAGPSGEKVYEIMWKAERWRAELPDNQKIFFSIESALSLTRSNIHDRITALTEFVHLFLEIPQSAVNTFSGFKPTNIYPGDEHSLKLSLLSLIELTEDITKFLDSVISDHKFPFDKTLSKAISISEIKKEPLARVPDNFEQSVVSKLVNSSAIQAIYKLKDDIVVYNDLIATVENYLIGYHSLSVDRIAELKIMVESIESFGYADHSFGFLHNLITEAEKTIKLLLELKTIAHAVQDVLIEQISDLAHFRILISLMDMILNAPPDIDMNGHTAYMSPAAPQVFKDMKNEAVELKKKIDNSATFFHLSRLPHYTNLRQIASDLKQYSGSFFSFLSPTLKKLRRAISGFVVDGVSVKHPQMVSNLYEIADLLEKAEHLALDLELKRVLGPLFKGINTERDRIEGYIIWTQSLRAIVDSQAFAEKIVDNISHCRDLSSKYYAKTKSIVDEIDGLLEKLFIVKPDLSHAMQADESLLLLCEVCKTQNKVPTGRLMDKPMCGRCKTLLNIPKLSIDEAITKNQKLIEHLRAALDVLTPFVANDDMTINDVRRALDKYLEADHVLKLINGNSRCKRIFGCFFKGIETDVHHLCSLADWVSNLLNNASMSGKITEWLLSDKTPQRLLVLADCITVFEDYLTLHSDVLKEIEKLGEIDEKVFFGQYVKDVEIAKIAEKYNKCVEQLDYLFLWNDYCKAKDKAIQLGLSDVVAAIENGSVDPDNSMATLNYSIYNNMARELVRQEPSLSAFTTASYENIRSRFVEFDKKIMKILREEIASRVAQRSVPRGNGSGPVSTYTDGALITLELNKRKRHIPTRQLIKRAGAALKALKPCFMMSPLSVAQYLEPGKVDFDLVAMDEASQIRPEDALGAFARGRSIIVVGDPNQLPPTSFFDRINESYDEDDTIAIEDTESILDISRTIYKSRRLRWHYRSEHESLISFSNHEFYDDDLIVFPSPFRSDAQLGIRCHYIKDAAYSKGRNLAEAQAIVNEILNHFEENPKVSLGIATFNREQRDLIEDLLDKKRKQDIWLDNIIKESEKDEEPFFIKNLENVQGDERDVIFISFTYGPDKDTRKVYQRFGPIGYDTGWRRLNVIFTRAKKRVEVFTSMLPTDIIISDSTPRGVRVLRTYLDYIFNSNFNEYVEISNKEPGSDFEIAVARLLNNIGYKTAFQIGVAGYFIDIGIVHPDRAGDFLLGVECDGATYHSGKSVRDRDRLRQEILERKGWKIHRIWSTDWFKNREKEIERLIKAVKYAEERDKIRINAVRQEPQKTLRVYSHVTDAPIVKNDNDLRKELIEYRKVNIDPKFTDQSKGILRKEMIEAFVKFKPTTKEEFLANIPYNLRNNISSGQGQFLNDIFQIIEEYL